jgi:hypothetical protein
VLFAQFLQFVTLLLLLLHRYPARVPITALFRLKSPPVT